MQGQHSSERAAVMNTTPINTAWEGYRKLLSPAATATQISETHKAFFAGALVLYEYMMRALDPGVEPTDADMEKMAIVDRELRAFGKGFDTEYYQSRGNA
jgi:hypothetical protein